MRPSRPRPITDKSDFTQQTSSNFVQLDTARFTCGWQVWLTSCCAIPERLVLNRTQYNALYTNALLSFSINGITAEPGSRRQESLANDKVNARQHYVVRSHWNAGNAIWRTTMFHVVASQTREITRNFEKIRPYSSSRSSKVIDLGVNRKPICDFPLVINSNFNRIWYRFWDIDA